MIRKLFKNQTEAQDIGVQEPEQQVKPQSILPLFFVHIPKTAGTSFRLALEVLQPMEKDYGGKAGETSALIRTHMYDQLNPYALKQTMLEKPFALTGHVPLHKYADFFNVRHILTFVRDPINQVVSHYNHWVSHNDYSGSFSDFYKSPQFRNLQSRTLNGFPLTLLGFVGITEQYNDSLTLINHGLGLEMAPRKSNVGVQAHQKSDALPQEVLDELIKLNQQDVRLYQQAVELHQQRLAIFEQGHNWAHLYAAVNPNDVLHGCAYFACDEQPVTLAIKVNGEQQAELNAQEFCGLFPKFVFPRQRYVGFSFPLAKLREAGISDIELVVCSTGQSYRVALPERFKC